MPTYEELARESWWRDEQVPPALDALGDRLVAHYGVSPTAVGVRGDNKHLRGYHRSRNWIKNSIYCTNRTYSVSETTGNRSGGDSNWCCALDLTIPRAELLSACQRLDIAVRAGRLEKITEWYGNTDGDTIVDGYNNIANRVATSDSSHLWHLHMSFDRGRANEDHTDVYEVLTGDAMWTDNAINAITWRVKALEDGTDPVDVHVDGMADEPNLLHRKLAKLQADVDELQARPPVVAGPVDPAALKAALLDPEVLAAFREAARQGAELAEDS